MRLDHIKLTYVQKLYTTLGSITKNSPLILSGKRHTYPLYSNMDPLYKLLVEVYRTTIHALNQKFRSSAFEDSFHCPLQCLGLNKCSKNVNYSQLVSWNLQMLLKFFFLPFVKRGLWSIIGTMGECRISSMSWRSSCKREEDLIVSTCRKEWQQTDIGKGATIYNFEGLCKNGRTLIWNELGKAC
jgi:hypothetical protein